MSMKYSRFAIYNATESVEGVCALAAQRQVCMFNMCSSYIKYSLSPVVYTHFAVERCRPTPHRIYALTGVLCS